MLSHSATDRLREIEHAADVDLARRARAGDERAIARLTERWACVPAMLRHLHRRFGAPLTAEELEDVEQETLAALWSKLASFQGRAALETWAFRFAAHEIHKSVERRRRRAFDETTGLDAQAAPEADEPVLDPTTVRDGLERVGGPASDVIRMRHFDELSFEDIARRTAEPLSTVKARYYRGLHRLREILLRHLKKAVR